MATPNPFQITPSVTVGNTAQALLIAGPCQIESRDHALFMAEEIKKLTADLPLAVVFKSSYDKANRTSAESARGVGMAEGLKILAEVKKTTGLPVLTDVHESTQVAEVAKYVDVLQIPAFLCRQTDLLIAAGQSGRTVNIKKGQFLAPHDMSFAAAKVAATGNKKILLCERGSCFGYRDLVVDMRGLVTMRQSGYPVIFDATHSVQSMGGAGGASGGSREFIYPLLKAALGVGIDGAFIECHEAPERAPSDAASMLPLRQMRGLLENMVKLFSVVHSLPSLL